MHAAKFLQNRLQAQKQRLITDKDVTSTTTTISDLKPNELLCLSGVKDKTIIISGKNKFTKIVIDNCQGCTVVVLMGCTLITNMLELTNSTNCTLFIDGVDLRTIQVDKSTKNKFQFNNNGPKNYEGLSIVWGESAIGNEIQVVQLDTLKDTTLSNLLCLSTTPIQFVRETEAKADAKDEIVQYRTRFTGQTQLQTVQLIREGGGYVTSVEDKKIADDKMQKFNEKIEELLEETLNLDKNPKLKKPNPDKSKEISQKLKSQSTTGDVMSDIEKLSSSKPKLKPTTTKVTSLVDVVGNIPTAPTTTTSTTSATEDLSVKEFFDSPETLAAEVKEVAAMIKNAKHVVVYTGAGISTAADIPDYRGPQGVWTLRERGLQAKSVDIEMAYPTFAHYALRELTARGMVKYIVSTNVDGLHRRSGVPENMISELHGNCYREVCSNCKAEYLRGYDTMKTVKDYRTHVTGRKCEKCKGDLKDTIIHFGESLPVAELDLAIENAKQADLALVLGTSMKVAPACNLPQMCLKKGGKMVIVNLQKTGYDNLCKKRLFAKTDDFMDLLMKELAITDIDCTIDALAPLKKK